ncbi:MAG TPA: CRTAC1 family protein [Planctomycetaceae bacterium]|nr:CRTAC1 family protein [Planctomycetaceae bacterium]HRE99499.1 CRTAC1 family protein [Pirellulaceae bacterium]
MARQPEAMNDDDEREVAEDAARIARAFRASLAVLVVLGLAVGIGAAVWYFRPAPKIEEAKPEVVGPSRREVLTDRIPMTPFADITDEAGITFVHVNGHSEMKLLPETMGGGVAFFDYDDDGDPDLLLVNSEYWPDSPQAATSKPTTVLYRNDGDGKFTDVSAGSGLDVTCYGTGVAVGDYDGDGRIDVYLTAVGRNRLFRNLGDGKFEETTDAAGVAGGDGEWSTSAGFFDHDADGDLDLFVANYIEWTAEINIRLKPTLDGKTRAYAPPTQFQGRFPYLFRNEGDGTFTEIGEQAGLHVRNPATGVPVPKGLGIAIVDFDRDGRSDVLLASDTVPNQVFRNRGDGRFDEIGQSIGMAFDPQGRATGAMGIDAGFPRDDQALMVAVGNFADEPTSLFVWNPRFEAFTDDAISTGLGPATREELTFGVAWLDVDLDGRLDFLAANGHLEDEIAKIRRSQRYEQPPHLFWNAGRDAENEFVSVPAECCGDELCRPMVGRGLAVADIDGDGDEDVILTGSGQAPRLLRNDQQLGHHWLQVRLRNRAPNRQGLGAEIRLTAGGKRQIRTVIAARGYQSQSDPTATFGLGKGTEVESIEVRWPDGETTTHPVDGIDKLVVIDRP